LTRNSFRNLEYPKQKRSSSRIGVPSGVFKGKAMDKMKILIISALNYLHFLKIALMRLLGALTIIGKVLENIQW
jgi:hypothetical protein